MDTDIQKDSFSRLGLAVAIIRNKPSEMTAKQHAEMLQRKFVGAIWSSKSKQNEEIQRLKYELALERNRPRNVAASIASTCSTSSSSCDTSNAHAGLSCCQDVVVLDAVLCLNASQSGGELALDHTSVIRITNAVQVLAERVHASLKGSSNEPTLVPKLILDALVRVQPRSWSFIELTQKTFLDGLLKQFILENDNRDLAERCFATLMHFGSSDSALRLPLIEVLLNILLEAACELRQVTAGLRQLNGLCWRNLALLFAILRRMNWSADLRATSLTLATWNHLWNQCSTNLVNEFPLFVEAVYRLVPPQ